MAQSNLAVRLVTGFIGAPLICLLLYLGPAWGWALFIALAASVGAFELFGMTHPGDRVAHVFGVAFTLAVIGVLWFFGADPKALVTLLLAAPIAGMLFVLWRLGDIQTSATRVMATAFGPLYVGGGLATLALLRRDGNAFGPYEGAGFTVLALTIAWLSDTGAYFAGRFLGKHKLYEAVSPKKTVEGALGGLAASVLGAVFAHFVLVRSLPLPHALALGVVGGALGQAGDLGESLIKRSFGVKDSGGIVPGHGGILDRVDALLVTGTITYLYVMWTRT